MMAYRDSYAMIGEKLTPSGQRIEGCWSTDDAAYLGPRKKRDDDGGGPYIVGVRISAWKSVEVIAVKRYLLPLHAA